MKDKLLTYDYRIKLLGNGCNWQIDLYFLRKTGRHVYLIVIEGVKKSSDVLVILMPEFSRKTSF